MSLKLMQGFDSMANDQDFRSQGWIYPAGANTQLAMLAPSVTGVTGRALKPLSMTISTNAIGADNGASTYGSSGIGDSGVYNTGVTVNQAWTAGGFSLGASAKFFQASNALNATRNQMGYDSQNNLYYTIMGTSVYTSPDLTTWKVCAGQPPSVSSSFGNTFSYMGNGIMMFCPAVSSTSMTVYWTNNGGNTWTPQVIGTLATASQYYCKGIATGNATYPMMINIGGTSATSTTNGIYVGTLGGTFVLAKNLQVAYQGSTGVIGTPGITSSGLLYQVANAWIVSAANAATADISQAANWTVTTGFDGSMYDMQYYPKGNVWVCASGANGFIYTLANPGTTSAPLAPTSTTRTQITLANSVAATYSMQVLVTNGGNNCIVTGGAGANGASMYAYCTDGSTWQTKFTVQPNNSVAYSAVTLAGNQASFYTSILGKSGAVVKIGVAASANSCNYIASSPDGVNNWVVNYMGDAPSPGTTGGYGGFSVISTTAAPVSGSTFTIGAGLARFNCSAYTAPNATVTMFTSGTNTAASSALVPTSPLVHGYEIVATAVAGTANTFTFQFYIDGSVVYTSGNVAMGTGTGDTTSLLVITFPRSQYLNNWDDLYFCLQDGKNTVGPLTAWNVQAPALTGDSQAQWTPSATTTSNAALVNYPLSVAAGYVSTSGDGNQDRYNVGSLKANSRVMAVQVESNFEAQNGTPQASVGMLSGTTELDSAVSNPTTLAYSRASVFSETDPATGVAWTQAGVAAVKVVVNKIS